MQKLAIEFAQPVTSFVDPKSLRLRWFTPTVELPLCGHGTLAAAHALWDLRLASGPLRFETRGGPIAARQTERGAEIELPASMPASMDPLAELEAALRAQPVWTGQAAGKLVALLDSEERVRALQPDLDAIARLKASGVVVTARGTGQFDFISRYFAPAHGVPEDPVTGSAHAVLVPFWAERLKKRAFVAYQASARGGTVHARLEGDRVAVGGGVLTVLRGDLA
jgi:PhzF family phenazine biosynthesis protein